MTKKELIEYLMSKGYTEEHNLRAYLKRGLIERCELIDKGYIIPPLRISISVQKPKLIKQKITVEDYFVIRTEECSKCGETKECLIFRFETEKINFSEPICFDCLTPFLLASVKLLKRMQECSGEKTLEETVEFIKENSFMEEFE